MSIPFNRVKPNGKVDLWDLGPQVEPKAPAPPPEPDKAKLKGAELAAVELEYDDALLLYKDELRAYSAEKRAHLDWLRDKGGPVKIEMWGVDARYALDNWSNRFKLDLPKGAKPGKAQAEAEEMERIAADENRQARAKDPLHAGAVA